MPTQIDAEAMTGSVPDPSPEIVAASESAITQDRSSEICLLCGFCCDGTLFEWARTDSTDSRQELVSIGLIPIEGTTGELTGFRLPCPQFNGSCSIYTKRRPSICGNFRCDLLRSVDRGDRTVARAKQIVLETKALRDGLPPNFDAILEEAGGPGGLRSLFARMGCLLPALVNPEAAHFREKHGSALATAFSLLRNLRSYFHAAPRGGKKLMGETPGPEVISTETL